jgi:uncharacterized protein YdcH (DUF465 family)
VNPLVTGPTPFLVFMTQAPVPNWGRISIHGVLLNPQRRHAMSQYDDLKAELINTDEEFRRLYEEHQEYEKRLQSINSKQLLSQEDEVEEKKIKLHKLVLKDHMEQILRQHRETRVTA